jgi:large subunit ribosomal protein L13
MAMKKFTIDAAGRAPGRIAAEAANILQGKNCADWSPNKDNDFIVEIKNVKDLRVTGKKLEQYAYYSHSGYPGGLRKTLMKEVTPEFMILHAIRKMLPDNSFRKKRIQRIKFV